MRNEKGYYLVYPEYKQGSLLLEVFRCWLLRIAQEYREADFRDQRTAAADLHLAETH